MSTFNQRLTAGQELVITSSNDATSGAVTALTSTNLSNIRLSAATSLAGIANGLSGKELFIVNANTVDMTVLNQSATASAANRIVTGTGADITIPPNASITLIYDATASLWLVQGIGTVSASSTGRNYLQKYYTGQATIGTVGTVTDVISTTDRTTTATQWVTTNASFLTVANNTSSPLRETSDYLITNVGAGAAFIETPLFTLDAEDIGKAVVVSMDLTGVALSGNYDILVSRYNSSNILQERISLAGTASTGTPASALLPVGTTNIQSYFLSSNTSTDKYAYRIRRLSGSSTENVHVDSLFVGPQAVIQNAYLSTSSDATSLVTISNFGTITSHVSTMQIIGNCLTIEGTWVNGTTVAAVASITIPSGYTIDTSKYSSITNGVAVGEWIETAPTDSFIYSGNWAGFLFVDGSSNTQIFFATKSGAVANQFSKVNGSGIGASGAVMNYKLRIPVTQLSNGFTFGARAVEEYCYNSTTTDAADTTAFAYGVNGGTVPVTLTASRSKRIRTQTPILPSDMLVLELNEAGTGDWVPAPYYSGADAQALMFQNATGYGVGLRRVTSSNTDVDVVFGQYANINGAATYGAAGAAWGTANTAGTRYRVRKVAGGSVVGYPINARNVIGQTSGFTVPAGYIGELLQGFFSGVTFTTTATYQDLGSVTLTPGDWDVSWNVVCSQNTATFTSIDMRVALTGSSSGTGMSKSTTMQYITGTSGASTFVSISMQGPTMRVTYDGTTMTIYEDTTPTTFAATSGVLRVRGRATFSAGNPDASGYISARRSG